MGQARVVEMIEVVDHRPPSSDNQPWRNVVQYWTKEGSLMAEHDPHMMSKHGNGEEFFINPMRTRETFEKGQDNITGFISSYMAEKRREQPSHTKDKGKHDRIESELYAIEQLYTAIMKEIYDKAQRTM